MVIYNNCISVICIDINGNLQNGLARQSKKLMVERKLNQKQLSQRSGITEASVSRYLKGERVARMDIIINFAKVLGVKVEYLLEDDNESILNPYTDVATAIARNGKNLTAEEKNKLIALIIGMGTNV